MFVIYSTHAIGSSSLPYVSLIHLSFIVIVICSSILHILIYYILFLMDVIMLYA